MIISSVHTWKDTRIFHKQAVSLAEHYHVELHAPAEFEFRTVDGVEVHGLKPWHQVRDRSALRRELRLRLTKRRPDLLHFHDPELIPLGLWWRLAHRIPVIYDMHEHVGATILSKRWLNPLQRRFVWCFYKLLEWIAVPLLSRVILAEESYTSFIKRNTITVLNYPRETAAPIRAEKTNHAVYIGDITRERGVMQLLKVALAMREQMPDFRMKIIGTILERDRPAITEFVKNHQLTEVIEFTGRLAYDNAMQVVASARVGLALLLPIENYTQSLPTKVMEYMLHEVPFIASNFDYWMNYLEDSGSGIFVNPLDIKAVINALKQLLNDPEQAGIMGSSGRTYVLNKLTWSKQKEKLLRLYRELLPPSPE